MERETVNFSIGEGFGQLLTQIAQEHLYYTLNPVKAIETLIKSLHCTHEMAVEILRGNIVLLTDVDTQQVIATDRIPEVHDKLFPILHYPYKWVKHNCRQMRETGISLKAVLNEVASEMRYGSLRFNIPYETIVEFLKTEDESLILDEFYELEEVSRLLALTKAVKLYIEKGVMVLAVVDWLKKTYPNDFEGDEYDEVYENGMLLKHVNQMLVQLLEFDFSLGMFDEEDTELTMLDNYMTATKEIDEAIKDGLKPVDIMNNYSAGWLSPKGEYYGLDGEIANMLHNQIADALQEQGLIPKDEVNPDSWLEQQGWVKIHENNVQFSGCLNDKIGLKNVNMTEKQIEIIVRYIRVHHGSIVKLGWKMIQISAPMFEMLAIGDPERMNKEYFAF